MPSLLDMTKVPMTNILEQCDLKSVLTLRKVCHDLRNFIDDANFKTELSMLLIASNSIDFSFRSYSKNGPASAAEHCTLDDLKIILGIQNSKLSNFFVENQSDDPGNWDALEEVMKNKPRPLQTEWLSLKVSRGSQALKILPYLDAKVLKNISLETPDGVREVTNLDDIERILELDQVKMASYLDIDRFFVNTDVKKFFHFEKVYVRYPEISLEDLVAVKEAFTTTSTQMKCFSLGKYEMENERFEEVFGEALDYAYKADEIVFYETKKWYFKIRTSKQQVLEINFILMTRRLSFKRVEIADVVENAIVRD